MNKALLLNLITIIIGVLIFSCNNHEVTKKQPAVDSSITIINNGLKGIWINHNSTGFKVIEIIDSLHVTFTGFIDRGKEARRTATDTGYFYYRSKAKMGYWDKGAIWISTDMFRFDYYIHGDTLIEFDKMGEQGKFIKVLTDKEKDFISFNSANLKGELTHISNVGFSERFVLNNIENEYGISSSGIDKSSNKLLSDVAEIGDSVIKAAYADTLFLFKKKGKKYYKFIFEKQ